MDQWFAAVLVSKKDVDRIILHRRVDGLWELPGVKLPETSEEGLLGALSAIQGRFEPLGVTLSLPNLASPCMASLRVMGTQVDYERVVDWTGTFPDDGNWASVKISQAKDVPVDPITKALFSVWSPEEVAYREDEEEPEEDDSDDEHAEEVSSGE